MKPAAQLIVHAAVGHGAQCLQRHLQRFPVCFLAGDRA